MSEDKTPLPPKKSSLIQQKKTEVIKNKFVSIAKEKNHLESVILDQYDLIKRLERERDSLTLTLNQYAESNNKIKEKLLKFDELRNAEISELKKKIEELLSENKDLTAEKIAIPNSLDRNEKNIFLQKKPKLEASLSSDAKLHSTGLSDTVKELKVLLDMKENNLSAASERIRQLEEELSSSYAGLRNIEDERNNLKNQLEELSKKFTSPGQEKRYSEEEFDQEVDFYSKEILSLRSDTEILARTINDKTREIASLNSKIEELGRHLSQRDVTLYEKIPLLQTAMQQLSISIEKKALETSSFGREIAELYGQLYALTNELSEQENILQEISENYSKGKESFTEMGQKYESANKQYEAENAELKDNLSVLLSEKQNILALKNHLEEELDDFNAKLVAITSQDEAVNLRLGKLEEEKQVLESKLSESLQKIEGLEANIQSNLAVLESKDQFIMETNAETEKFKAELSTRTFEKQEIEAAKNRLEAELAHLHAGVPEMQAEIELLHSEKHAIETEKNQFEAELANLQASFNDIHSENSEIRQRIGDLDDEKLSLESKLTMALQRIEELETDVRANQALLESKDHSLAEVNAETEDIKVMLASLRLSKQDLEATKSLLEAELADLTAELGNIREKGEDYRQSIGTLEDGRLTLESKLTTALQRIEGLETDVRSNQTLLESKDQFIMETNAETEKFKAELATRTSEKLEIEAEKSRIEAELARLQAGVPDMQAEIELLRSEKHAIETEKNLFGTELSNLRVSLNNMNSEDEELRQSIGALEDGRLTLESKLTTALQRIEELETDVRANQTLLESKDHSLAEVNAETEDLKAKLASLDSEKHAIETEKNQFEAELANLQASFNDIHSENSEIRQRIGDLDDEKLSLESKLTMALQRIEELETDVRANQALLESKDHSLAEVNAKTEDIKVMLASLRSSKQDLEATKSQLEAELARLKDELEHVNNQGAEYRQIIERSEDEKTALESKLSESRQKMTEMEEEIGRHVSVFASQEQLFSGLKSEAENSRSAIEAMDKENAALKDRLSKKEQELSNYSSEKVELLKKVSVLEEAFGILRADSHWERTSASHTSQRPANIVPTVVYREKKVRPGVRYMLFAGILVAAVIALIYLNAQFQPLVVTRHRPPVTVNADANLDYREIYDRNTRTAALKNIKVQATLYSESLLIKEGDPSLAGFDFNTYMYFRVNINSLEGPLAHTLIQNPLDSLKLAEDTRTIGTSGYKQIDKIKTFYKGQVPITVTFFCAFPKSALGPDRKDLTLTLLTNGIAIPLVWDIQTLIVNSI